MAAAVVLAVLAVLAVVFLLRKPPASSPASESRRRIRPQNMDYWLKVYREWRDSPDSMVAQAQALRRWKDIDHELMSKLPGASPEEAAKAIAEVYELSLVAVHDPTLERDTGPVPHRHPGDIVARCLSGCDSVALSRILALLPASIAEDVSRLLHSSGHTGPGNEPISSGIREARETPEEAFRGVWARIVAHSGETFYTVRELPFTYRVDGNQVVPSRTDYPLHMGDFRKACEAGPAPGPGSLPKGVMGASYVWAILSDHRVQGWQ